MTDPRLHRRSVLTGAAAVAFALARAGSASAQAVPFSAGTERPRTPAPPGATDCHHHIYDHRFPVDPRAKLRPADATVADYRLLQARLGTSRNVVVQPSTYGTDNRCMLDALAKFGPSARGVAVVNTKASDADLMRLHGYGVRGIRFNLVQKGATTLEMLEPLAARVRHLGWHVQLHMLADEIAKIDDFLNRLPAPIVFDHMARIPGSAGVQHPAFRVVAGLLEQGRAWVKLSGAYMDSEVGPPTYADRGAIAKGFVSLARERCLWGTDWPHPTEKVKPDDALLFDLLAEWVPDEVARRGILVDNPENLYGFSQAA
jgi:D-galactarolactone isomerase